MIRSWCDVNGYGVVRSVKRCAVQMQFWNPFGPLNLSCNNSKCTQTIWCCHNSTRPTMIIKVIAYFIIHICNEYIESQRYIVHRRLHGPCTTHLSTAIDNTNMRREHNNGEREQNAIHDWQNRNEQMLCGYCERVWPLKWDGMHLYLFNRSFTSAARTKLKLSSKFESTRRNGGYSSYWKFLRSDSITFDV